MDVDHSMDPPLVFDEPATAAVVEATGLALAEGVTLSLLREMLEDAALAHYWCELEPGTTGRQTGAIAFAGLADSSVTPSRLRDRLQRIARSARRVYAGTARRPLADKVAELLERLGHDRDPAPTGWSGVNGR